MWGAGKSREAESIIEHNTDPHFRPAALLGTAPVVNQAGFYAAFASRNRNKMFTAGAAFNHLASEPSISSAHGPDARCLKGCPAGFLSI